MNKEMTTPPTQTSLLQGWPQFAEHELRAEIIGEMHARPFERIDVPRRVFLMGFITNAEQSQQDRDAIGKLCRAHGLAPPAPDANYHSVPIDKWHLRWERHNEFTTYRWDVTESDEAEFAGEGVARLLMELEFQPPGELIVATQLKITTVKRQIEDYEKIFNPASICIIGTDRGKARVATDFQADLHGFTRFIVEDHGMSPFRAGALVQRVLEIETYRTLALMGFPAAKKSMPLVNRAQDELAALTAEIAAAESMEDNHQLLKKLTDLAAELEAQAASTAFRFAASQAYNQIIISRLNAMHEEPVEGARRFSSFFKRRLEPAMATCRMVEERQGMLSRKLMRTAELLRTRIQFELEQQNRSLLSSMNRRARLQLRLQQTVEGLSVAAVSYYVVGLLKYLYEGAAKSGLLFDLSPTLLTGLSVPLVLAAVWLVTRRIHHKFTEKQ